MLATEKQLGKILPRRHACRRGYKLLCACLLLLFPLIISTPPTHAQNSLISKPLIGNPNKPLLLQADELIFDNKNNRVVATGNVEIYYNDYTLLADQVTYDRAKRSKRQAHSSL